MSDTVVAVAILPVLIGLVVVLECARVGCTRLTRYMRGAKANGAGLPARS